MMWDERYAQDGFIYGTEPNDFLREFAGLLQSPVLSLAEGEGRNAVFLAGLGLEVLGVDASAVGLGKAQAFAASRGVVVQTLVADLAEYAPSPEAFGSVVSISAHFPSDVRAVLYRRVRESLIPGGIFLLEAYTPAQVGRGTGGPPDPDFCISLTSLQKAFDGFEIILGRECEREVIEGSLHTGMASVVQFIARKPRP